MRERHRHTGRIRKYSTKIQVSFIKITQNIKRMKNLERETKNDSVGRQKGKRKQKNREGGIESSAAWCGPRAVNCICS